MERKPRASTERAGGRRLRGVRRAGRWLGLGVGALCLVAVVVVDTGAVGFFVSGGDGGRPAGRTYTIDRIKTHRLGARIQATPDLEDHELPDRTQIRFWPIDTPASVQTLRLGDAIVMPDGNRWDLIWGRRRYPIDIDRNTTWHIDLTIPAESTP